VVAVSITEVEYRRLASLRGRYRAELIIDIDDKNQQRHTLLIEAVEGSSKEGDDKQLSLL